jgi:hypothetical protein
MGISHFISAILCILWVPAIRKRIHAWERRVMMGDKSPKKDAKKPKKVKTATAK